jgi:hypothetical protein
VEPPTSCEIAHAHARATVHKSTTVHGPASLSKIKSIEEKMELRRMSSPITVLDSPVRTSTTGGEGTANDPILLDDTPPHPDSPVKVVLGERYRYDDL